jgi:hypothetical protein
VETLIEAAKRNRHGHRDATMVLLACLNAGHLINRSAGRRRLAQPRRDTAPITIPNAVKLLIHVGGTGSLIQH